MQMAAQGKMQYGGALLNSPPYCNEDAVPENSIFKQKTINR